MIVPNGKRRNQVSQGGLKHESIWNASFSNIDPELIKVALAPTAPESGGAETPKPKSDVDNAMQSGSMRGNSVPPDIETKGGPQAAPSPAPSAPPQQPGGPGDAASRDQSNKARLMQQLQNASPDQIQEMLVQTNQTDSLDALGKVRQSILKLEQELGIPLSMIPTGDLNARGGWKVTIGPTNVGKG